MDIKIGDKVCNSGKLKTAPVQVGTVSAIFQDAHVLTSLSRNLDGANLSPWFELDEEWPKKKIYCVFFEKPMRHSVHSNEKVGGVFLIEEDIKKIESILEV